MSCRSGCPTKDHDSYSDCLRDANVRVAATINSALSFAWDKTRQDTTAYRAARVNGIQPEGTTVEKVRAAEQASRMLGRPYDAHTDPPANMIVNKNTARFVNASD